MTYELYYWPDIQGRGEFVRLALEEAGAGYRDVVREDRNGMTDMVEIIRGAGERYPPFAPPFLKDGDVIVSHVSNILLYLGPRLNLSPKDEALRHVAHGLQLTISDLLSEVHDTHHPIAADLYYEDQMDAAKKRSSNFLSHRLPKFMGYFERILSQNVDQGLVIVGEGLTYVDLSLFQVVEGLRYAFPEATSRFDVQYPALMNLRDAIRERPNIAAYLASDRRIDFDESGIFRHYPELDRPPERHASAAD